jgi:hypothetical protein
MVAIPFGQWRSSGKLVDDFFQTAKRQTAFGSSFYVFAETCCGDDLVFQRISSIISCAEA